MRMDCPPSTEGTGAVELLRTRLRRGPSKSRRTAVMSSWTGVWLALPISVLAACAIGADSVVLDRALAEPSGAYGVVVITRDKGLLGLQCEHRLSLDGKPFAELKLGQTVDDLSVTRATPIGR